MKRAIIIGLCAALAWSCRLPTAEAGGVTAVTIGTSSAQALAAPTNQGWRFLVIDNESTTATIACTFDGTAAINTAGSFTIPPESSSGTNRLILGPFAATIHNAIDCIASASAPATILAE